jgi:DNA-binding MarR family transcriptional regulator
MKIEDEIKQVQFIDNRHKMVVNIMFTARFIEGKLERLFKKYGITSQQYNVLRILKGQFPEPICAGDVLSRMLDRSSNITRLMEKLLSKNLVTRKVKDDNRRMHEIVITQEGIELLDKIFPEFNQIMSEHIDISEQNAGLVSDLLDQFRG